ncbi:PHP domain-containing protein [Ktedonospora formicarum]|uniref:Phosphatase n=1 Tax=Ktedonospora formicarum TaxID=2778364 RepID=A0A8J3I3J8_9CHLR|nr:PHP domain-containing protein [Ktedonospora formicarum]GHO44214.1 phosphatase [Ktedonospora formicarum]
MTTPNLVISPDAAVDLHMHTTYSDGRWPADQLIDYLIEHEFNLVAVTDHDRVDKVAEIQALAASKGLPVLSGVEITCTWNGNMVHMLCYGFDPQDNVLQEVTERVARTQLDNTHEVHDTLLRQGHQFPREAEALKERGGKLFRPTDNITLLLEHGYVADRASGLRLIEQAGFRTIMAEMAEAVDAAHQSGAVCLIAHPGRKESGFTFYDTMLLDKLRTEIPLDGIEVYHPYHSQETIDMYIEYVHKHDLLLSTGSDSHGLPSRMPRKHRAEVSKRLLERLGVKVA